MKKSHPIEWLGVVLLTAGLILRIVNDSSDTPFLPFLVEKQELFYWGGLGVWALGYMIRKKEDKEQM